MAKRVDPLKAKQRKQKILAAVLGVLFLGLMAFQVPRVLKMMKTPPPPHANASATVTTAAPPAGTPSLAAPTLRGEQSGATTGSGSSLASADPTALAGQLASFSRFASKDPFSQQLSDDESSSVGGSSGGGSGSGSGTGSGTPPVLQGPSSSPRPGSAVISVNGTLYTVSTNSDFPQPTESDPAVVPLFHLVSVTAHSAKISIVGGSYSSGDSTVTLKENKPVTLVNTADGTRYRLVLKPLGTDVPATGTSAGGSRGTGAGTTTTTPTSTTVTLPSP